MFTGDNSFVGYTAIPASTPFDLSDALVQVTYLETPAYNTQFNYSYTDYIYTTLPPPVAAVTSVLSVTAVKPLPTGLFSEEDAANAFLDPMPEANVVVPGLANKTVFSAYVSKFCQIIASFVDNY